MSAIEDTMMRASYPLMTVDELLALRAEMAKRHVETQEDVYAELHDELNAVIDFREIAAQHGMTEEQYIRYWEGEAQA